MPVQLPQLSPRGGAICVALGGPLSYSYIIKVTTNYQSMAIHRIKLILIASDVLINQGGNFNVSQSLAPNLAKASL
ncbi:hypothetical protein Peur_051728 [Populus x canadensis]